MWRHDGVTGLELPLEYGHAVFLSAQIRPAPVRIEEFDGIVE
jgi:hypothetical protein